jgi:O-antigen ligase
MALLRREPLVCAGAAALGVAMGLIVARQPLLAVGLIVAVIGTIVVITRADLVLLTMIAALPWENKLHYPNATLSTVKAIGLVVLIAYLLRLFGDRRTTIHLPSLFGIVVALGIWIGVSLVVSPDPSEGLAKLIRWGLFFAFFFLVVQLIDGRREVRRALRWFTASVTAAAVYALWLFVFAHNGYRVAGPLEDPNDFAYLLACALPVAGYLMGADRKRRPVWGMCFVAIGAAMLATFSRGALVGIGAVLVWGVVTRRIPIWVIASGLVTAVLLVALALTAWKPLIDIAFKQKSHIAQSNVESREALWGTAVRLTERHPLAGVGPGRYPTEALPLLRNNPIKLAKLVTHNTYLEILSENGIPALLLFIAYLTGAWLALREVQRRARHVGDIDARRLATALQASLIIATVSATFLSEELTAPFWLLGALAVVLVRQGAATPRSPTVEGGSASSEWPAALAPVPA